MMLQAHIPASPLNEFINALVYYDGLEPVHTMDRFLPDGNTEMIINLSDTPQYIYDNETLQEIQICRRAWVSGVRTRPITIPSGKGSKMMIVAFKKGKAHPFYPLPMNELLDWVVEAEIVLGQGILDLREQLLACPSVAWMFSTVERFLLQRAGGSLVPDPASRGVEFALSMMMNQPGIRFQMVSEQIGYSQKHFISLFKTQVGAAPKQYMKIMRFQQAIREIEQGTSSHWSEIALRNGFYDQSHFIHEFRDFSGFTPGEYIRRRTDTLNYVPVL
ncbi:MAG TPA: AraC family transcriptional regulator [Anaerolineales bacterium]|nr:AraC family transcriptional regulator [Anaerolineales bacterium]